MCMKGLAHPATRPSTGVVRLPGCQQPTHGFAALWLRLVSGPAQPATHLRECQPLGRPGLDLPKSAGPALSRSLRLVSKYASLRLALGPALSPPAGVLYVSAVASGPAQPSLKHSSAQPAQPKFQQQRSPAARQPATHPWLRSLHGINWPNVPSPSLRLPKQCSPSWPALV